MPGQVSVGRGVDVADRGQEDVQVDAFTAHPGSRHGGFVGQACRVDGEGIGSQFGEVGQFADGDRPDLGSMVITVPARRIRPVMSPLLLPVHPITSNPPDSRSALLFGYAMLPVWVLSGWRYRSGSPLATWPT